MLVQDTPLALGLSGGLRARGFAARYVGHTVIALGAHPDDIELGIGGTLALLTGAGVKVVMAIVSVPADSATREGEAMDSAAILDCKLRVLMDGAGQRIEDMKTSLRVGLLDALVTDDRPAAVLTHGRTEFHRDHVTVYHAAVSTQRLAQCDL